MKTSFEVGGPAFPQAVMNDEGEIYYFHDWHGMSLRDYFAAKAMNGYISGVLSDQSMSELLLHVAKERGLTSEKYFAEKSYAIADAMLEARK